MSKTTNIFSTAPVEVQNKSGFDMSFESIGTAKVGTLVPVLVEKALPGDKISAGMLQRVSLPPMATNFYGRVDVKFESFFVPNRLLWGGWNDYITQYSDDFNEKITRGPAIINNSEDGYLDASPSSLTDYLGCKIDPTITEGESYEFSINALPYLAYHRIYDDYYRNSQIQKPVYQHGFSNLADTLSNYPYVRSNEPIYPSDEFNDGASIQDLRQRNYAKDYFTTATLEAQLGNPQKLEFDVVNNKGSFTIASLRMANSLQKFIERNNLVGYDYYEQTKAQFGVKPHHLCNRPIYIGSQTFNVYNNTVTQTAPDTANTTASNNKFKGVGAQYANSMSMGSGSIIPNFTATEHGYFFVLMSLVPHAYYATGTRRYLMDFGIACEGFPMLASVGDQKLKLSELINIPYNDSTMFGYTQRYADYKFHIDEVHGELRDDGTLSSFALKRSFDDSAELSSEFLQVSPHALDEVFSVNTDVSRIGYWYDIAFSVKMVRALPVYSIPTLGDEKDTHTYVVDKNGSKLN